MAPTPVHPEAYFLTSDVSLPVKLLILNAHGSSPEMGDAEPPMSYTDCLSKRTGLAACDMHVSCQLHTHGRQHGTSRTYNTPGSRLRWNEWVAFRGKYSSLSPDAHINLFVCGSDGPRVSRVIGTARLGLFDDEQQLRTGIVKLRLQLFAGGKREAELGDVGTMEFESAKAQDEMAWLDMLSTRHERALAQPDSTLDWLNRPTYALLEERQQASKAQLAVTCRAAHLMAPRLCLPTVPLISRYTQTAVISHCSAASPSTGCGQEACAALHLGAAAGV